MPEAHSKVGSLSQHYLEKDLKLRKFVPIIHKSAVYPVVYDARRTVLSLPPIINSAHSAVRLPWQHVYACAGLCLVPSDDSVLRCGLNFNSSALPLVHCCTLPYTCMPRCPLRLLCPSMSAS